MSQASSGRVSSPLSRDDLVAKMAHDALERDDECLSCGEQMPANECPKAQRPCGHHCNCSWIHDCCHWCGVEFGEDVSDAVD